MSQYNAFKNDESREIEAEVLGKVTTDVCFMQINGVMFFCLEMQDVVIGLEVGAGKILMAHTGDSAPVVIN